MLSRLSRHTANKNRTRRKARRGRSYSHLARLEQLENRLLLTTYSSTDVPQAIPDQSTITSTLSVPDALTIDDVNVQLDITHTNDQDLDVYLIAPDGTRVELFTDVGGGRDNFTGTTLDDEAGTAITSGSAPFAGSFRPEGSLADFDGKDSAGTWTLEIDDDRRRQTGQLIDWSVTIDSVSNDELDDAFDQASGSKTLGGIRDASSCPTCTETADEHLAGTLATEELQVVVLPGGNTRVTDAAARLGELLGRTGRFFTRGGAIVRLQSTAGNPPVLEQLKPMHLSSDFETVAQLRKERISHGQAAFVSTTCPESTAKLIANSEAFIRALPPIQVISPCPVLTEFNGKLSIVRGYNRDSGIFAANWDVPEVSLDDARKTIVGLLEEFRFAAPADKSRAVAAIVTPALVLGGLLNARAPVDLGESDKSQTGKGYRNRITAAIYGATIASITQRKGGVGSLLETFDTELIHGAVFVSIDNVRGKIDSPAIESFLTEDHYNARRPYMPSVRIDPRRVVVQLTSNEAEITPDFANRCSCVRLLKQPEAYSFKTFAEGDLLAHIRANRGRIFGAIFAIIKHWHENGKQRTSETRHDFRAWAQTLDWIVQKAFGLAPLLDGHRETQQRMASPAMSWLRTVAIATIEAAHTEKWLRTSELLDIIANMNVDIPGLKPGEDVTDERTHEKALRAIGRRMGQYFSQRCSFALDHMTLQRRSVKDEKGRDRFEYSFTQNEQLREHPTSQKTTCKNNFPEVVPH